MLGRGDFLAVLAAALTLAAPLHARGENANQRIVLKAGRLADTLRDLSIRTGTGLLFDPGVVGNRRNPRVSSAPNVEDALRLLLQGSGLSFRRTGAGTIVIFVAAATAPEQELAVPEILVIGRRTQNSDIRRTENDIQPYRVTTANDIIASHADNIDQFLRTRLPSDAEPQAPWSNPGSQFASNRSEVNFNGLGSNQTLVLIDGARMPSIPSQFVDLATMQPDLNGVPLLAIDRIESLTATAGGIYGPGATGGVINVLLKRDYRGADINLTYGLTDRGDAARKRVDARFGFTPDHGRTDVMVTVSRSVTSPLASGDRDYAVKARRIEIDQDVAGFVADFPVVNGVLIRSLSGSLSLISALGGTPLGSTFTYTPAGYGGVASDGGATLLANAGTAPPTLSPDGNGSRKSLTIDAEVTALLANVRHHFGPDIEGFVDLILFQNNGRAVDGGLGLVEPVITSAPTNPFGQNVVVTAPLSGFDTADTNKLRTVRLSTGLIVRLPHRWKAEANFSIGSVDNKVATTGFMLNSDFAFALGLGIPGVAGEPIPNPFGDWATFVAALQAYKTHDDLRFERRDNFQDASLRLAGPVLTRRAGTVTLTLLAERRHEEVPVASRTTVFLGRTGTALFPNFSQTISSLYGELRAPIVPRASGPWFLRGLELQLALRYDDNKTLYPQNVGARFTAAKLTERDDAVAYTAGLRFFPRANLMARASVATGILPPTPQQLLQSSFPWFGPYPAADPKRGGEFPGTEAPFTLLLAGSRNLLPERARTWSFGIVLNPEGAGRPRISLDFTRIGKHDEISIIHNGDVAYFLANEDIYPGRITRAPLTPSDIAAGFTGGAITQVDTSALNIGKTTVDALELRADYQFHLDPRNSLRLYGSATWQPRLTRRLAPDRPATNFVGFANGPLRWRGNAGLDWDRGPLALGFNAQYYGRYFADSAIAGPLTDAQRAQLNVPGTRISPQIYFDFYSDYRFKLADQGSGPRELELRLGINNLLDRSAAIVTNTNLGYSYYGDPRGRRFEAALLAHF